MNLDDQENPLAFNDEPEYGEDIEEPAAPATKDDKIAGKSPQKNGKEPELLLSKSEFDEIAFRMTNTLPALALVRDVISSPTPLRQAIMRVEDAC